MGNGLTPNSRLVACMRMIADAYHVKADVLRRDPEERGRVERLDLESARVDARADEWEKDVDSRGEL